MERMNERTVVMVLGDDVSTDTIYPGRYMATVLPTETPQYAFADWKPFQEKIREGNLPPYSVILAGDNFGCGSSREQAVSCLKGHDLIIVARSVARIFLQNAINLGLSVIICPEWEGDEGDILLISDAYVANASRNSRSPIQPLPKARKAILDAGGLIAYTRKRLIDSTVGKRSGL